MKELKLLLVIWLTSCGLTTKTALGTAAWLTDFGSAKLRAAAENKPILILFTGSDWCPACKNLQREVFSRPEFEAYANANLVLLEVDFPRYKQLSGAQQQNNNALAKHFNIRAYPTMVLLDVLGRETDRFHYREPGVKEFLSAMETRVSKISPLAERNSGRGKQAVPDAPLFNGAPTAPPPRYTDLVLKGVSGPKGRRLAWINNETLGAGETATIKLADRQIKVRCVEVWQNSAIVAVEGETERRELKLREAK